MLQPVLAILAVVGLVSGAHAAITTFATFSESVGAPDFVFSNNSPTNATFTATSPIDFRYLNIVGLPADLRGIQSACINISMSTTQPAVSAAGSPAPLSQAFPVVATTITVTRVVPGSCTPDPAAEGDGSRTTLLQVNSTATISGLSGSTSGNLNAATSSGQTVIFNSDFLNFNNTIARDLAIALTQINPSLGLSGPSGAPGTFLNSFSAVASGNFSSDPVPLVSTVFIAKSFSVTPIQPGGTSTLTFMLANNNGTAAATNVSFTDTYPGGLVNASPANVVNTCGGLISGGIAGGNTIGLSGATLAVNASCTLSVDVTAPGSGCFANTSSVITSTEGSGNTASATLCAGTPPGVTKLFSANPILPGGTSTLTVNINNPNATQITGVKFTDSYPSGLVNATPNGLTNSCAPGTASAPSGGSSLILGGAGGTLAAGASCTVTVNVLAAASGSYANSTGAVTTNQTGPGGPATATLVVGFSSTKAFSPNPIVPNATSVMTITLNNPTASAITGVNFVDTYPANLVNTSIPAAATTCGAGVASAAANGGSVSLAAGAIAAGASCTITVNVTSPLAGTYANSTGPIQSDQGAGAGSTGTLIVLGPLNAAKTFLQNPINRNGTSVLQIMLTNPNPAAVTNASFTDSYPANLFNAGVPNAATTCAGGVVAATPGAGSLTFTGATVPASGSCTISVTVTSGIAGSYVNTTGAVTSSAGSTPGVSGTLLVLQEPVVAKAFSPASIAVNGTSVLTVSITNPNSVAMSGISFGDTYPANVVNTASPNGVANNCGVNAVVTALPGDNSLSLGVGAIAPGATCTVSVNVTSAVAASYVNHTGPVNSSAGTGQDATATLNVLSAFTAAKSFSPTAIAAGAPSLLTIMLSNPNATPITGVTFTDSYPAGLVNTAAPGAATTCGGTLSAIANDTSVALVGGLISANSSCTVTVNVTSNTGGSYLNSTGAVTSSNAGSVGPATATLTVAAPINVAKAFAPTSIAVGGSASLSVTLTNPNSTAVTGAAFTDNYPAGVINALSPNAASSCGGTLTAVASGTSLALNGATVPGNATCTVSVNVTSNSAGSYLNSTGTVTTTNAGSAGPASATLTVNNNPITVGKAFTPSAIAAGGASLLTITLTNPNAGVVTGVSFTDSYPAGVLNTGTPNGVTTCGGSVTAAANGSSVGLSGGSIAPNSSCTVTANVTSNTGGSYLNSTGVVTSSNAGSAGPATATLTVVAPLNVAKAFAPTSIVVGGSASLSITLTNANSTAVTGAAFSDVYPAGVINALSPNAVSSCGGTVTAAASGNSLALSGATVPANAVCTVSVNVTSNSAGSYLNSTGTVMTTNAGSAGPATATLTVSNNPITVAKSFTPSAIAAGGSSLLTITLTNPNPGAVTGVALTDSYPAGVLNTGTPNGSSTCGGTVTAVANGSSVGLSGGSIAPNSSCILTVNVTSSVAGAYLNSTGSVSTTNAGTAPAATATLTVNNVAASVAKSFAPAQVLVNVPSVLTITLNNPNPGPITGIAFTDNYPANLTNTGTANAVTTCGGTVSAANNGASLAINGGTIPAGGSCTVSVNVQSSIAGSYVNATGTITSSNAPSFGPASATLSVLAAPTVAKAFAPNPILANAASVLTITLSNANATPISGVTFADTYPANLVNTGSPAGATTCGGTATAAAGGSSVALSAGTIPANGSCTVSVNVTSAAGGIYINNTGTITTGVGPLPGAQGTLTVLLPATLTKVFTPATIATGAPSLLTITLVNPNASTAVTGVAFTDTYPANVVNTATPGAASTCGGTVTAAANGGSLVLGGGTIPAGGTCQVSVNVTSSMQGVYVNTTGTVATSNVGSIAPASATLTVNNGGISVTKLFTPSTIASGGTSLLTVTLNNPNPGAVMGAAFNDAYPVNLANTSVPGAANTCGGTVTAASNGTSVALSGGTIPANGSCQVTVNVTSSSGGSYINTTGTITTTNAGTAGPASATLLVVSAPSVLKAFTPATVNSGAPSLLTVTLTNPNAITVITGVAFTDAYPANLVNAAVPNAATSCGGVVTAQAGGASLALSGGTIPPGGSCTATVSVTSTTPGPYLNSTGVVTSTNAGSAGPAMATLMVSNTAFTLAKSFGSSTILPGAPTVLTITLTNPNPGAVSGASFSDNYPAGLFNTANATPATTCGGTLTAVNNGNAVGLTGGTIPANGSCVVTINVTAFLPGSYLNSIGSATAQLFVGAAAPAAAIPTLSQWALVLLAMLLWLAGATTLRRSAKRTNNSCG